MSLPLRRLWWSTQYPSAYHTQTKGDLPPTREPRMEELTVVVVDTLSVVETTVVVGPRCRHEHAEEISAGGYFASAGGGGCCWWLVVSRLALLGRRGRASSFQERDRSSWVLTRLLLMRLCYYESEFDGSLRCGRRSHLVSVVVVTPVVVVVVALGTWR